MSTTRIVIAGGGIAGVPLAYALKAALHGRAEVIVVSDRTHFHFVPANPWLALGLREESEVAFALEPLLAGRKIDLQPQAMRTIQPEENRLVLADGTELPYDYLVLATGICPDWERVPGVEPGAGVHSVILPWEAAAAYGAYCQFLKRGGGPVVIAAAAGAAILGPVYEYAFLLDADLRRRGLRVRVPITLITPEPYPGHLGLDKPVVRDALEEALKTHAIGWIGNAAVQGCRGRLQFTTCTDVGKPIEHGADFAYAMIWPPFRGVAAVAQCTALCDEHGLVPVDDYQRSRTYANVFALGACTAKPALTRTPVPVGAPDAVYAVQQQVAIVSRNIVHCLHGEPLISARGEREQWLEDPGKRGAAYLSMPQMPLRDLDCLRSGQWVYKAERRFENNFINQILFGAGERGQVAALVRRLSSQPSRNPATVALGAHLPINDDTRRKLEALGQCLGVSGQELGRQLLERAVADAVSYLDPDSRQRVTDEVRAQRASEREAEQERVRFEGGAP